MNTQPYLMDLDDEPDDIETRVKTQEEGGDPNDGATAADDFEVQFEDAAAENALEEEDAPKGKATENEDDDLDALPYSERVKRRIARERDVTRREREARMAAEERAARLEAELEQSRRQKTSAEIDGKINEVKEKIKEAQLADDALEVAEHTAELANLKREKATLEAPPARKAESPPPNKAREAWAARNPWFDTTEYDTQSDLAVTISKRLQSEGYDPNSEEFWEEIDERLASSGVRLPKAPRRAQPVAGVSRDLATSGKSLVKLTAADLRMLESMGIDHNDKAALREYALNKMNRGAQ